MCGPDFLVGSIKEAVSQEANCFMVYTGSPQSIARSPIDKLMIPEFKQELKNEKIDIDDVIIHAPYIINLANPDAKKRKFALSFFQQEIDRVKKIGAKYLVLHPGSNKNKQEGIELIAQAINAMHNNSIVICLETMAGKGNEIGGDFKELAQIISLVKDKSLVGVCLDTCHINDFGYDVHDIHGVLKQFDDEIGLKYLKVIHINDSLNKKGVRKDRHANIGEGTIGLKTLQEWANNSKIDHICKILETPWCPNMYRKEIRMLRGK